ncbi:hypothetical protein F4810DRAFT_724448 [Camillea tinctor]|nr:hypothetical protein F4810DRAFT_724448 [Camillea tinctor]
MGLRVPTYRRFMLCTSDGDFFDARDGPDDAEDEFDEPPDDFWPPPPPAARGGRGGRGGRGNHREGRGGHDNGQGNRGGRGGRGDDGGGRGGHARAQQPEPRFPGPPMPPPRPDNEVPGLVHNVCTGVATGGWKNFALPGPDISRSPAKELHVLLSNGNVQDFMRSQTAWIRGDMFIHEPPQGFQGFHLPPEWELVSEGVYKDTSNRRPPNACRARRIEDVFKKVQENPCRLWSIRHADLPPAENRPEIPENVHSFGHGGYSWFMFVPVLAGNGTHLDPDLPPPPPRDSGWCLIDAVQDATSRPRQEIWLALLQNCADVEPPLPGVNMSPKQLTHNHLRKIGRAMDICFRVHRRNNKFTVGDDRLPCFNLYHSTNH